MAIKIDSNNVENILPLYDEQLAFLYSYISDVSGKLYVEQISFHLSGALSVDNMKKAIARVIRRNPVLRSIFRWEDISQPVQIFLKHVETTIVHYDFSKVVNPMKRYRKLLDEDRTKGIDITDAPFRVLLVQVSETEHYLVFTSHHILYDGWSLSIILREVFSYYNLLLLNKNMLDDRTIKKLYIRDSNEPSDNYMEFWNKYLEGYNNKRWARANNVNRSKNKHKCHIRKFDEVVTRDIMNYCTSKKITMAELFYAIWSIVLCQHKNTRDVLFGTTSSGRENLGVDVNDIVGMFVKTLPLRIRIDDDITYDQHINNVKKIILQRRQFENVSLSRIKKVHNNINLADAEETTVVVQNYPVSISASGMDVKLDSVNECTEFGLLLQVQLYDGLTLALNSNADFDMNIVESIFDSVEHHVYNILDNTNQFITYNTNKGTENQVSVMISSTFISEPLESSLKFALSLFEKVITCNFDSYNYVLGSIKNANSIIHNVNSETVVLFRFEDFILQNDSYKALEEISIELIESIKLLASKQKVGMILFDGATESIAINSYINRLNQDVKKQLCLLNIYVAIYKNVEYGINVLKETCNTQNNVIPYSQKYYDLLGKEVGRIIMCRAKKPFKVIAVDCDNTLWRGIIGEGSVDISHEFLSFQQFLVDRFAEGMLIVLLSKNNEEDVFNVIDYNDNMILKREHIIDYSINWNDKSQNVVEISKRLNLGLDSFIFIDDSEHEIIEMMNNCPEILSILFSSDYDVIPYLNSFWAFDRSIVSEEDEKRTSLYKSQMLRESYYNKVESYELTEYLDVNIVYYDLRLNKSLLDRVSQLSFRVNQFNLNQRKYMPEELDKLVQDDNNRLWAIGVKDRFGDYGVVGGIIITNVYTDATLSSLWLSCRVLGKKLENILVNHIWTMLNLSYNQTIKTKLVKSDRNEPIQKFIMERSTIISQYDNNSIDYEVNYLEAKEIEHVTIEVRKYATQKMVDLKCFYDHVGIATYEPNYLNTIFNTLNYKEVNHVYDNCQNVHLQYLANELYGNVELVMPNDNNSPCLGVLERNGPYPYHLCYSVESFDELFRILKERAIGYEIVQPRMPAVLFNQKEVLFIYVHEVGLFELIENKNIEQDNSHNKPFFTEIIYVSNSLSKTTTFLEVIGYAKVKNSKGNLRFIKNNSPDISVLIQSDMVDFFKVNGPHLYKIRYRLDSKEVQLVEHSLKDQISDNKLDWFEISDIRMNHEKSNKVYEVFFLEDKDNLHQSHYLIAKSYASLHNTSLEDMIASKINYKQYNVEEKLKLVWSEFLQIDELNVNCDFFSIGGDSLKAARMVPVINEHFKSNVTLSDVFRYSVFKEMVHHIEGQMGYCNTTQINAIGSKTYPLTPPQASILSSELLGDDSSRYSIAGILMINGRLDLQAVKEAFKTLLENYPVIRTQILYHSGEFMAKESQVFSEIDVIEHGMDVTSLSDDEIAREILCQNRIKYKILKDPLYMFKVFIVNDNKYALLYDFHHIIIDGISLGYILKNFLDYYVHGNIVKPKLHFGDYAHWLAENAIEESAYEKYWKSLIDKEYFCTRLEGDISLKAMKGKGDMVIFYLPSKITLWINDVALKNGVTVYSAYLAVFSILISRWTKINNLLLGTPIAGRDINQTESMVGMFAKLLNIHIEINPDMSFKELITHIRKQLIILFDSHGFNLERLKNDTEYSRDQLQSMEPHIVFAFEEFENNIKEVKELDYKFVTDIPSEVRYEFLCTIKRKKDKDRVILEYDRSQYSKQFIKHFLSSFEAILLEMSLNSTIELVDLLTNVETDTQNANKMTFEF